MTRSILAAIAAAAFGFGTASATEPQWQKLPTVPYTLNNKQDAIAFADAQRGWYGNGTGRIYRTDDGGASWRKVWEKRGTYVRVLDFADRDIGFMGNVGPGYFPNVTDRQPLYVTRDGGTSWTSVKADGKPVTGICAIDVLKIDGNVAAVRAGGRVGGPANLIESFDGGANWQARNMRDVTGMILDIKFVDADIGFIAGASEADEDKAHARILKTTDGGKTWRAVFDSSRAGDNNWKLAFPTPQTGYGTIISYQAPETDARGYVVKTTDGGEKWTKLVVTRDVNWIPYGIGFVGAQHGFVGGSTGGYETRDGGVTWTPSAMGLSVNKFRFVTRDDGGVTVFAIGQDVRRLDLSGSGPSSPGLTR
jgi:photosystem II stability/assembly factor-like uncharacterized protein